MQKKLRKADNLTGSALKDFVFMKIWRILPISRQTGTQQGESGFITTAVNRVKPFNAKDQRRNVYAGKISAKTWNNIIHRNSAKHTFRSFGWKWRPCYVRRNAWNLKRWLMAEPDEAINMWLRVDVKVTAIWKVQPKTSNTVEISSQHTRIDSCVRWSHLAWQLYRTVS